MYYDYHRKVQIRGNGKKSKACLEIFEQKELKYPFVKASAKQDCCCCSPSAKA